jgi:asparagine synthase (glutamine-hydrolysing)
MCGIAGVVGFEADELRRRAALNRLAHRGPDASGERVSTAPSAWLGHRRLAIVDLSDAGRQPMRNEDGRIWSVCNGEIYNYPSLRGELESRGHVFASSCDSEVVVHAYEEWGDRCLDRLEGMFALGVWDEGRRRFFGGRDRLGIKPFYYARCAGGLVFASEADAAAELLGRRPDLDPLAIAYVLTLGYVPSPHCIWSGIRKLEPGCQLRWSGAEGLSERRYWSPPARIDPSADPFSFPERFERVLAEHLLSDVPMGLFLSGGLDSTAVAAGLAELGCAVEAVTIGFPDAANDEGALAAETARRFGFSHQYERLDGVDVDGLLDAAARAFDEPQGYGSLLTMLLASRTGARRRKVLFSGDGGDELFGGYRWYRGLEPTPRGRWAWPRLWGGRRAARSCSARDRSVDAFQRRSPLHRHAWRVHPRFLPEEAEALLSPVGLRFGDGEMLAPLQEHFETSLPAVRRFQRVDLMTFCADSINAKVDRASMSQHLEVRVPLLDRRLIEWGLSLPVDAGRDGKAPLREYLRGRAPGALLNKAKQGFSLRSLANYPWEVAEAEIDRGELVQRGFLNPRWREYLYRDSPYYTGRVWSLLFLSRWADARLREGAPAATPSVFAKAG